MSSEQNPVLAQIQQRFEEARAKRILASTRAIIPCVAIVYPNNDPGSDGIARAWDRIVNKSDPRIKEYADLLYAQAVLAEAGQLKDPTAFTQLVSALMVRAS